MEIEINSEFKIKPKLGGIMITPPLNKDYWTARVKIPDTDNAVVCFPKFGGYGIGFQVEDEDWNTKLPETCGSEEIYNHIKCNCPTGKKEDIVEAIELLQEFLKEEDKL